MHTPQATFSPPMPALRAAPMALIRDSAKRAAALTLAVVRAACGSKEVVKGDNFALGASSIDMARAAGGDELALVELNLDRSRRRAEAFRAALMNRGIAVGRMHVRAHGGNHPVAENASAPGRAQNRRADVVFSDADGKLTAR